MRKSNVGPAKGAREFVPMYILGAVVLFGFIAMAMFQGAVIEDPFHVSIHYGENPVTTVQTKSATVENILRVAGITLGEYDVVTPSPQTVLTEDATIMIRPARPITVTVDGSRDEYWVTEHAVQNILREIGVELGSLDRVIPSLSTRVTADEEIRVIRVVEEIIEETETLPFKVVYWAVPELERGETTTLRQGEEGELVKRIRRVYEDGELVHRAVVETEVVRQAVDHIVGEGTRSPTKTISTPDGIYHYVDVIEMEATGYEPGPISTEEWADGLTFTGHIAQRGIVAVDPSVIPLGTRVYVEGYGEGLAADIGGAIKGNRIDLCFDTYEEAIQWGRQTVKVYILGP